LPESGIDLDYQVVDLFTGEQYKPEYSAINPSHQVPVLEDGDFRLTESSAILKYLADKIRFSRVSLRPAEARARQRADGLAQHGFLPGLLLRLPLSADLSVHAPARRQRAGGNARVGQGQGAGLAQGAGREPDRAAQHDFCAATTITIADYLGSMMVLGGEAIDCKFGAYPNICRWLGNMKALKSWTKVNEAFYKYVVDPNKGKEFVQL
jgi:glutathione S-transferase